MERSVGRPGLPLPDSWVERPQAAPRGQAADRDEQGLTAPLLLLLGGEVVTFAALAASGNMPAIVSALYRALLTL